MFFSNLFNLSSCVSHDISIKASIKSYLSYTAVRSGDYYMFDEFDDTEIQLKDEESSSDEDAPKEMGIGKVLYIYVSSNNA